MATASQKVRLDEAFDRIEETILPCISMMLETLLAASDEIGHVSPKELAAELQTLAAELEELTRTVERSNPHFAAGDFKTAAG